MSTITDTLIFLIVWFCAGVALRLLVNILMLISKCDGGFLIIIFFALFIFAIFYISKRIIFYFRDNIPWSPKQFIGRIFSSGTKSIRKTDHANQTNLFDKALDGNGNALLGCLTAHIMLAVMMGSLTMGVTATGAAWENIFPSGCINRANNFPSSSSNDDHYMEGCRYPAPACN